MTSFIPDEHLADSPTRPLTNTLILHATGGSQNAPLPDPYHHTFSDGGQSPSATSFVHARARVADGDVAMPAAYLRGARTFNPHKQSPARLRTALNLLGVVTAYGAVTNHQAAAFTGATSLADLRNGLVADLFASGLIDISSPYRGQGLGSTRDAVSYQLGDRKVVRRFLQHLTTNEALAVTGGRALPVGNVHTRHDILAAEVALRFATNSRSIGTVVGPHFSTFDDFFPPNFLHKSMKGGPDLVIVRADGLRVAVELTSSIGQGFRAKVKRWAGLLGSTPFCRSGLVVVFLVASAPAALLRHGDRDRRLVYRAVADAVPEHWAGPRRSVAERIGVATWREWFPTPGVTTKRFDQVRVDRPTGAQRAWEPCDLWDPRQFCVEIDDDVDLRAIIANASLLSQTPVNLREAQRPARLSAQLLREAVGEPKDAAPALPRNGARAVGAAQGVAGVARISARLIGPTDTPDAASSHPVVVRAPTIKAPTPAPAARPRPVLKRKKTA